ncbi:MAG: hypothetical protein K2X93_08045 [Candidatus Obscuribacterales bacterium]|nr:hypothetical protein [Candidatus Obscuribacterales bacterium]
MSKRLAKLAISATFAVMAFFAIVCQLPGLGQIGKSKGYTVLIETDLVKDEFEYKGSKLGPTFVATVTYRPTWLDDSQPILYEKMWLRDWQLLGLRRYKQLDFSDGGQTTIEVRHKSGFSSLAEAEAAAKAILRIYVDIYATKHPITILTLPDDSMSHILNQMPRAGFKPGPEAAPDVPISSPMIIPVRSASGTIKLVLYYGGPVVDDGGQED